MYHISRDKLTIINTSVLFCTMVLLIVLLATGSSSTHDTMYWSKQTYYSTGNKVTDEQWYLNYARCVGGKSITGNRFSNSNPVYSSYELFCTPLFADFGPSGWGPSSIVSIVGLSLLLISLIVSIMSFIPWLLSTLKTYVFGDLYLLIIVIVGFVINFTGTLMMTIIHRLSFNDMTEYMSAELGGSIAVAWLSTCFYLISLILTVIIFRTGRDREVSEESRSEKGNEHEEVHD